MRRGCPNQCEFCAVTTLHHKEERPLEKVFEEIQHISARKIFIYDQNLTWNMEYAKRFLQGLPGINKRWLANGTANMLGKDDEFLGLAKDAHLFCWFVGFESISQKSLNGAKKKTNKSEEFASVIQKVRSYGMILVGSFIFGFDEDTPDLFDDTLQAISDWGLEMAEFHILTPFPGTALYKRLKVDGRLLTEDWSKYTTTNVVFEPKNMSAKELYEGTRRVAKEYHSIPRIMKRSYNILETTKNPSLAYYVFQRNLRYRERYANQFNF
ncbi:MAG TPA: hypothetical protein DSN98_02875 [Thermoplasmata archaeon]|jgi:radical SAM superfamily enzyme YgiQ (UPF0313 family)|nr:MAG TPA: hypothetical protein DSN98_02875 [Thermoplasmata archaeon]